MHTWFQNLNDGVQSKYGHWLNFRGSFGRSWEKQWIKYEFHTGPACRFTFDAFEDRTSFSIGFLFFSLYLTIYGLVIPFIKKGDRYTEWGREYGFYWYEWTFWAFFGRDPMGSSSSDPWYYKIVWHPLDTMFGREWHFDDERMKSYGPVLFEFRNKPYQMDDIKIVNSYWFRSRIPFGLWHRKRQRMYLDIKKPPQYAGKGENSYDCGDDGTYGSSQLYKGPKVNWQNRDEIFDWCCRKYCDDVLKSIKKRGRASGDELPREFDGYKYIGQPRDPNEPQAMVAK